MVILRSAGIQPQPPEAQTEFKVSFLRCRLRQPQDSLNSNAILMAAGLSVELVYSSNRDLDILPAGVNKGSASKQLAAHWNIPPDHVRRCVVTRETMNPCSSKASEESSSTMLRKS